MKSDSMSDENIRIAKVVLNELSHRPLLIEIVEKVSQLHNEGLSEQQVIQATKSYFSTKSDLSDSIDTLDPEEIRVQSLPDKYQRLDWT